MANGTEKLLQEIADKYLNSDFNGYGLRLDGPHDSCQAAVRALVEAGRIDLHFGEGHPNPHIKALPLGPSEEQLEKLDGGQYSEQKPP
jgi:hypothetical protein